MDLIFASKNKGKIREVEKIMAGLASVQGMTEAGVALEVIEDGDTFEENALKKAVEVMQASGKLVIADDSGLEIDCLNKEPGVQSARYLGEDTPYTYKNSVILDRLKDVLWENRTARFVCAMAAAFPDGRTVVKRATIEGYIAWAAKGEHGFGYDPIFFVPDYEKTMAELSPEIKNKISHRAKALQLLKDAMAEVFQ